MHLGSLLVLIDLQDEICFLLFVLLLMNYIAGFSIYPNVSAITCISFLIKVFCTKIIIGQYLSDERQL